MDFPKAVIVALLYYAMAFLIDGLGNAFVPSYANFMSYVWWIVSVAAIFLLTRHYYFGEKPKHPLKDGFLLGILIALITFIIEILLVVYGYGMGWGIFLFWNVWFQYFLVVVSPIIAAITK